MRRNPVSFALTVGMALVAVLFGFTLLSAGELAGFAATEAAEVSQVEADPTVGTDSANSSLGTLNSPVEVAAAGTMTEAEVQEIVAGDALFKGNCAQCHAVNEQVVGPALAGLTKRRPIAWIIPWVKNSSKMVAQGDDYAVALYEKYSQQQMPSFDLSAKEITSIVAYINSQEGVVMVAGLTTVVVSCQ